MKQTMTKGVLCVGIVLCNLSYAVQPQELMKAVLDNSAPFAEGVIEGPLADAVKTVTKSKDNPTMRVEKGASTIPNCTVLLTTMTVPNIPSTSGDNLGTMVSVNELTLCPENKLPKNKAANQIISCKIGLKDCEELMGKNMLTK